jgi:hypothetical protein
MSTEQGNLVTQPQDLDILGFLGSGDRSSSRIRLLSSTLTVAGTAPPPQRRPGGRGRARQRRRVLALELFWFGRTLLGCVYGSSDSDQDVPRLFELAAGPARWSG